MIHNLIHQFGVFVRKNKKEESGWAEVGDGHGEGWMREWCGGKGGREIKGKQGIGRGRGKRGRLLYLVSSCLSHPERRGATRRRRFVTHIDRFEDPLSPTAFDRRRFACPAVGFSREKLHGKWFLIESAFDLGCLGLCVEGTSFFCGLAVNAALCVGGEPVQRVLLVLIYFHAKSICPNTLILPGNQPTNAGVGPPGGSPCAIRLKHHEPIVNFDFSS